jgi:ubiquinone/menaquinone biosynthesis C-methylase UbiE
MHRKLCSSADWAHTVEQRVPDRLAGIDLGEDVLEIGPGFGATTRVLVGMVPRLTAVEVDQASAERLAEQFAGTARIVHGDGADLPFEDNSFTGVVCFTMLHHVPSRAQQDALFAQSCRVLRPGGVFAGFDSQLNLRFRFLHLGDTMVVVDPRTLPDRLAAAGFVDITVKHEPKRRVIFSARKPDRG